MKWQWVLFGILIIIALSSISRAEKAGFTVTLNPTINQSVSNTYNTYNITGGLASTEPWLYDNGSNMFYNETMLNWTVDVRGNASAITYSDARLSSAISTENATMKAYVDSRDTAVNTSATGYSDARLNAYYTIVQSNAAYVNFTDYFPGKWNTAFLYATNETYSKYQFTTNNFNGSGNFTTTGVGTFGSILASDLVTGRLPIVSTGGLLTSVPTLLYDSVLNQMIINENAVAGAASLGGTALSVRGADNSQVRFNTASFGAAGMAAYAQSHARGTAALPEAVQAGDVIMSLEGWGYGATAYSVAPRVMVRGYAGQTWTDSEQQTYMAFWTTPVDTIVPAERMRIDSTGNIGIGITNPSVRLEVIGAINATDWTNATTFVQGIATATNTTMKGYVDSRDVAVNTSATGYSDARLSSTISTENTSMKAYVDSRDTSVNTSATTHSDARLTAVDTATNTTVVNWASSFFMNFSSLINCGLIFGNASNLCTLTPGAGGGLSGILTANKWCQTNSSGDGLNCTQDLPAPDLSDYYTSSQTDTTISNANTTMKAYVDARDTAVNTSATAYSDAKLGSYLLKTGDTATGNYTFDSGTLFIDSTQDRVGIGTTSPGAKLTVNQSADLNGLRIYGYDDKASTYLSVSMDDAGRPVFNSVGGGHIYFQKDGALKMYIEDNGVAVADDAVFHTGNSAGDMSIGWKGSDDTFRIVRGENLTVNVKMIIDSTGNVGIGTASPATSLDVNGTLTLSGNGAASANIKNGYTYGSGELKLCAQGANCVLLGTNSGMSVGNYGNPPTSGLGVQGNAIFNGNVGIGTASPSQKLQVEGSVLLNDAAPTLVINESDATANNSKWNIRANGEQLLFRVLDDAGSIANDSMIIDRTGTAIDRVVFPNGNVGIGITNPSVKLEVIGGINATDWTNATTFVQGIATATNTTMKAYVDAGDMAMNTSATTYSVTKAGEVDIATNTTVVNWANSMFLNKTMITGNITVSNTTYWCLDTSCTSYLFKNASGVYIQG